MPAWSTPGLDLPDNENHLLHALHVSNCGFRTKNFFEHQDDFVVRSDFPLSPQSLSKRTLFLDDYIPLAFVLILFGIVGVAAHTEIVRVASNNRWKFPPPVFLKELPNLDVPFNWLVLKPISEVLSKATGIDEMFAHLREVESTSLAGNLEGVHSFTERRFVRASRTTDCADVQVSVERSTLEYLGCPQWRQALVHQTQFPLLMKGLPQRGHGHDVKREFKAHEQRKQTQTVTPRTLAESSPRTRPAIMLLIAGTGKET